MSIDFFTQLTKQEDTPYPWSIQSPYDSEMAGILLGANKWDCTCYHGQQAVEKTLNFMLSDAGQTFRYSHEVHEFVEDSNKVPVTIQFDDVIIDLSKELSQYNTIADYPLACDEPVALIAKEVSAIFSDSL
ncbi:MAG: HEPN domain-containing protein [Methylobacter sp.]|nr:HEPN domain-containing protein [Methylobacter sp.]